jgi:hypothetical protein
MSHSDNPDKTISKAFPAFMVIVIVFVMLIGGFYLEEDARGKMAWSKFRNTEEANGEKFDLSDFVPPPVPDNQNFVMTPLLRPTLDYTRTTNGIQWNDSNAWQHAMSITLGGGNDKGRFPDLGDPEQGELTDLAAAAKFYRDNPNYPQSAASANDAEVVLTALSKFAPDLKELQEAAASRPLARFPIEYDLQPPSAILLPHLACVKGIASVCKLRAVTELETHRTSDAFADLQTAFRLSDSIHDEPILIDHLVRIAILDSAVQGIREGIARHAWADYQLLEFEKYLGKLDLLAEYEHTMRGERARDIANINYFREHGGRPDLMSDTPGTGNNYGVYYWMPSGWYYRNMTMVGEMFRDYILPSVDESNRVVSPELGNQMNQNLALRSPGPYNLYAKMLMPALTGAVKRSARAQTWVDEARIACALERYRLQYHDLPGSLDALTPQFIPKIPHDLFDGQPLRYLKNPDGTYVLYSIGWNERDDGGTVAVSGGGTPRADLSQGDWVWKFPAK